TVQIQRRLSRNTNRAADGVQDSEGCRLRARGSRDGAAPRDVARATRCNARRSRTTRAENQNRRVATEGGDDARGDARPALTIVASAPDLGGSVAVVTGATRGVGKGVA